MHFAGDIPNVVVGIGEVVPRLRDAGHQWRGLHSPIFTGRCVSIGGHIVGGTSQHPCADATNRIIGDCYLLVICSVT